MGEVKLIKLILFADAGPEYISMTAGEARDPRRNMPRAFSSITYRLVFFFIIGALSVGIVCPYNAPRLVGASGVSAANSPYVISVCSLQRVSQSGRAELSSNRWSDSRLVSYRQLLTL